MIAQMVETFACSPRDKAGTGLYPQPSWAWGRALQESEGFVCHSDGMDFTVLCYSQTS